MKKLGFILFISLLALFACNKEKSSDNISSGSSNTISASDLPTSVTNYVADNYPDATINSAAEMSNSQAKYVVLLSTEEELAFDGNGNFLGDGQDFCPHGGPFPGGDSLHHGHPWHGCPPNWINIDSLPGAIKTYISTNYPNFRIWHAEKDTVCPDGAVIEVLIRKMNAHPPQDLKLFFDQSNNFIMTAQRTRFNELPQPVQNYITSNFNDYHQCLMSEKLTLLSDSINYAVYVHQMRVHKRVVLTETGTLVCEQ